ncbi:5-formyltetrahydrofolate cyclo-ligase [Corynebacterium cystitidis]|uniref:5-formyltetrahydrofolate cyclo-ligase n=1 Tax=Corynebacterium cystitidis TaxID=35757 RepID=UPI00211F15B4|nr:5-formyltetrahydrofolate cyclo-ligase [Corynebacterium cystitidis]
MPEKKKRKDDIRAQLRSAREDMSAARTEKRRSDASIVAFAAAYVRGLKNPSPRVAAYCPLPDEPGYDFLLTALASQAASILLPIAMPSGALEWAPYRGQSDLESGTLGIWQPTGPRHGNEALARCDAIFLPALAIDTNGNRLGKGAGYYDRALAGVKGHVPLIALVYDHELIDELPSNEFDIPVDSAITPAGFHDLQA